MKEYPYVSILTEWAETTACAIDAYSCSFERTLLLKMTLEKNDIKIIYKAYRTLTTEILRITEGSGSIAAEISRELCLADKKMDMQRTAGLSAILEIYIKWSNALSAFIRGSDKLFAKKEADFRLSEALALSNTLRSATEKMKGDLQNEELYSRA